MTLNCAQTHCKAANPAAPWLSKPSSSLNAQVSSFIHFLRCSKQTDLSIDEQLEVSARLQQLISWSNMATHLHQKLNTPPTLEANDNLYIQALKNTAHHSSRSNLIEEMTSHQFEHPLRPSFTKVNNFTVLFTKPAVPIGNDEDLSEEKINFANINDELNGFVLEKLLRRVDRDKEFREIYTAYSCRFSQKTGKIQVERERFVVKRVRKTGDAGLDSLLRREFRAQGLLSEINHPGINALRAYFEDDNWMVSVSTHGGNVDAMDLLAEHVTKTSKGIDEDAVKSLLRGAAEGLLVAHNMGIAHRDVSLENMVVNDITGESQLIDWGHCVAHNLSNGNGEFKLCRFEGPIGKVRYMGPKLVLPPREENFDCNEAKVQHPLHSAGDGFEYQEGTDKITKTEGLYDAMKSDVFALGVCLFSALVGQMPFENVLDKRGSFLRADRGASKLIAALRLSTKGTVLSEKALDLLDKCLTWNSEERISMEEVIDHPFFKR